MEVAKMPPKSPIAFPLKNNDTVYCGAGKWGEGYAPRARRFASSEDHDNGLIIAALVNLTESG